MNAEALIQRLIDAGASAAVAGAVVAEAMMLGAANAAPQRSKRQERNARYYEAKKNERLKASENVLNGLKASETSEQDGRVSSPVPKETSPLHPPKEITLNPTIPTLEERAKPKRGSRLPVAWEPSLEDIAFAQAEGMSMEAIRREAAKYRDYWIAVSGAKGVKTDWPATWRNWIRRNHSPQNRDSRNERPNDIASAFDRLEARLHGRADLATVSLEPDDGYSPSGSMPAIAGRLL